LVIDVAASTEERMRPAHVADCAAEAAASGVEWRYLTPAG
jgi:hypothetical protein